MTQSYFPLVKFSIMLVNSIGKMNLVEATCSKALEGFEILQGHGLLVHQLCGAKDLFQSYREPFSSQGLGLFLAFSFQDGRLLLDLQLAGWRPVCYLRPR